MKIVFYISQLGGGGAERVTSVIASGLAQRGHDVYLVVKRRYESDYDFDKNIKIVLVEPKKLKSKLAYIMYYTDLREKIIEINPDVIVGVMHLNFYRIWIATQGLGIPIVASDHSNFHRNASENIKKIRYVMYDQAAITTVLTENDKEFMKHILHNMVVMYNPLSFPILDHKTEREKTVICAGRVTSWHIKGFDRMIEIWSKVCHEHPDWRLLIAGNGKDTDFLNLKEMIKEKGVEESVSLLGFRTDIKDLMSQSSIFALPSREEGFPCVLTEAMSQGCAPMSFEIHGNIREIITDGEDGLIVPDGDLDTFAEKLNELMNNEEFRNSIGEKAMKSMERFTSDKIVDRWEEMLTDLIDKKKNSK